MRKQKFAEFQSWLASNRAFNWSWSTFHQADKEALCKVFIEGADNKCRIRNSWTLSSQAWGYGSLSWWHHPFTRHSYQSSYGTIHPFSSCPLGHYKSLLMPCPNQIHFFWGTDFIFSIRWGSGRHDLMFSDGPALNLINICQINDWLDFVSCSFYSIHC